MSFVNQSTASLTPDRRRTAPVVALRRLGSDEMFPLDEPRTRWTVGSSASCDIALHDPFVSGVHCVIERRPSGVLVVRDHRSRNGTFVDGHPIEGAELRVGCYLSVGRTTLVAMAASGTGNPRALDQLRGRDPVLRATVDQAMRAAQTDCAVLIVGETGHRQGSARARDSRDRTARRRTVRRGQLRRDSARADRIGAVRSRERRVHRRDARSRRLLRRGEQRHALPRRDRRAADRAPAESLARARDQEASAASADSSSARSTCASSRRRTGSKGSAPNRRGCASISTTASRRSCSRCRRCASAWPTCASSSSPSSRSAPRSSA